MTRPSGDYSTKRISKLLLEEIKSSLRNVSPYGSVEIYVQDNTVTQITVRNIKKTNSIKSNGNSEYKGESKGFVNNT